MLLPLNRSASNAPSRGSSPAPLRHPAVPVGNSGWQLLFSPQSEAKATGFPCKVNLVCSAGVRPPDRSLSTARWWRGHVLCVRSLSVGLPIGARIAYAARAGERFRFTTPGRGEGGRERSWRRFPATRRATRPRRGPTPHVRPYSRGRTSLRSSPAARSWPPGEPEARGH